jgi:hypothetical protein
MSFSLQANWQDQSLYLWARTAPGQALADEAALRAAIGEVSSDALLASTLPMGNLAIWLDRDSGGQENSPTDQGTGGSTTVASARELLRVPALVLGPVEAMDLLTSLPCEAHATCGASLAYWAMLARFVIRLIAAKQFVPRVETSDDGTLSGSWRLLVSDRAQLEWLEKFALAMPPVCRAAVADGPDSIEPANLIETFLSGTTDALVRRAVSDDPFFLRVHERAAAPGATPEVRWLSALLGPTRIMRRDDEEDDQDITAAFAQQAQAWLSQLDDSQAAAMRLCFILEEPDEEPEDADLGAGPTDEPEEPELTDHEVDLAASLLQQAGIEEQETRSPENTHPDTETTPQSPWRLSLHLQALDGEGDLIDAAALWQGQGRSAILGRSVAKRQAALLSELSRAAEVFPLAQSLLAHPAPSQLLLSTTDAYAFIRHWGPQLRDRGFGVTLPEWATHPDEEVGLRLVLNPLAGMGDLFDPLTGAGSGHGRSDGMGEAIEFSTGHFGLDSLMNFDWQIAIGNLRLTTADFEHLVSQNLPLVKHKGRWIHLDLDATRRAVEFIKKKKGGQITLAEAFRTAFTAQKGETGLNVIGLSGTDWLEQLLEQAPGKSIESITQPKAFAGDLRPYQLRGLHWLSFLDRIGLGACLADDMGLGKTIQLIALLLSERERVQSSTFRDQEGTTQNSAPGPRHSPPKIGPTLLFAPTSVVGNWLRELQRFAAPLKVMVHHGAERLSGDTFAREAQASDVVITSYSLAHRDKDEFSRVHWHRIVLDEAQKIKNPAAAATIAIRDIFAPRRIAMTGTPIENHFRNCGPSCRCSIPACSAPLRISARNSPCPSKNSARKIAPNNCAA